MKNKGSTHVVFAWELGSGYGHVAGFRPLVKAFLQQGYRVSVVSRYLHTTKLVLGDLDCAIFQAPLFSDKSQGSRKTFTYPDILLGFGYHSLASLTQTLEPWCNLIRLLDPNLVVIDHGPTALLACRCEDTKYTTLGTGFLIPPNISPSPVYVGMQGTNGIEQEESERLVLNTINEALISKGKAKLKRFCDLFYPKEHLLATLPELDHYPTRTDSHYFGPRFDISMGMVTTWPKTPDVSAPKVFAYVKEKSVGFTALHQALLSLPFPVIMHIPDASEGVIERSKHAKNLILHTSPVSIVHIQQEAGLIICNGGHGVVSSSLIAGVRLLLLPNQLEQNILTLRLTEQRLAMALTKEVRSKATPEQYFQVISASLTNNILEKNVRMFKEKYKGFSPLTQLEQFINICESILQE